jgi:hypothetical protein
VTESEFSVLVSRLDSVKEQFEENREEATRWRERFDEKLLSVQMSIASLPCPTRAEGTKGIHKQIALIWGLLVLVIAATVAEYFKR